MRKKMNFVLSVLMTLVIQLSFAQQKDVSGVVSDATGNPLPGVTVAIKGTSSGVQTDFYGAYTINASEGDVLVYTFLGMGTTERTVGADTSIDVVMQEDTSQLDEVVLTVLGTQIKKDEDLSSSTNVDTKLLQRSGETGVLQGLSGKTSGVLITRSTGDPGAGAYIQIRGQNTVLGSSSPLIILDGVPISNNTPGNSFLGGSTSLGSVDTDGTVQQSRLNDINPDDIEKITVLKGTAAAAIYGSGAANGVLIIRTKRGKKGGKPLTVSLKQAVSFDQIFREFEKQEKYGQGASGSYSWNSHLSWGDKIANRSGGNDAVANAATDGYFEADNGNKYYKITGKNSKNIYNEQNRDQVFQTGVTSTTNLSVMSNRESGSTYLSLGYLNQEGIVKGQSSYDRVNLKVNNTSQLLDNLTFKLNTTYVNIASQRIQQGSNTSGLYLGYLRTPVDFNNTDYKGNYYASATSPGTPAHRSYRNGNGTSELPTSYNNPGWTINEQTNPSDVDRFIVNPELNWNINDNNMLTARYAIDYTIDSKHAFFPVGSSGAQGPGALYLIDDRNAISTANVFLTSNYEFGDLSFTSTIGTQFDNSYREILGGQSLIFVNQSVGDLRIFGNAVSANELPLRNITQTRKSGMYAAFSTDYGKEFFLDFGGRYETASTVKDPVLYPSVSGGWVITKNLLVDNSVVSFAKLRASYGEIGIEPITYTNRTNYTPGNFTSSWGDNLQAALYGGTYRRSFLQGNPDLTVETVKEMEVGLDLRFLNDKITLGGTYYDRTTHDAILRLDLAPSTGFTSTYKNAAQINNKGVELDLSFHAINTKDLQFSISANWSTNQNMVESLSGVKQVTLSGFTSVASSVVEGEPFGVLWGTAFARDEDGKLELNDNGFPTAATEASVLGDPNPDWRGGAGFNLNYKGIGLSAFFDTSQGNDIWIGTEGVLKYFGIHPETANESVATSGLKTASGADITSGTTFRGNIHDFGGGNVALDQSWYTTNGGGFGDVSEAFVRDGSWMRFREATLSYTLPSTLASKMKLSALSLSLTGRNLFLWSDVEYIDPETNLTGSSKGRGLEYFNNPATRSYVVTLNVTL